MEHNIGVGAIVGLVIATSIYIFQSNNFNKKQKTVLLLFIIFPPAQWILALIMLIYNKNKDTFKVSDLKSENISEYKQLENLHKSGILTNKEFEEKVKLLNNTRYDSNAQKSQKENNNDVFKILFFGLIAVIVTGLIVYYATKNSSKYDSNENTRIMESQQEVITPADNTEQYNSNEIEYNSTDNKISNRYYVYCSVYGYYYDAKSGMNGFEPYLEKEGNYCSQIIELNEEEIPKFNEEFRNNYAFTTYNNGYGTKIDRTTFKINKFITYEEALNDKDLNCITDIKVNYFKQ